MKLTMVRVITGIIGCVVLLVMDAPGWGAVIGGWVLAGWVREDDLK